MAFVDDGNIPANVYVSPDMAKDSQAHPWLCRCFICYLSKKMWFSFFSLWICYLGDLMCCELNHWLLSHWCVLRCDLWFPEVVGPLTCRWCQKAENMSLQSHYSASATGVCPCEAQTHIYKKKQTCLSRQQTSKSEYRGHKVQESLTYCWFCPFFKERIYSNSIFTLLLWSHTILTSLRNGSIKATTAGYLLMRVWYISTNSSGDFRTPVAISYFLLGWEEEKKKINSIHFNACCL